MKRTHLPDGGEPTWSAIRAELGIVDAFPAAALAEADAAAAEVAVPALDRTEVDLFTIDPAGSLDLDQAMALERVGTGYRVHYAIADVGAFVRPDGPIDAESRVRGETMYGPDERVPMLPPALSEGAASLLPDLERPSVLWTLDLDARGELVATDVRRARVRSRRRLDYVSVQQSVDAGTADEQVLLLQTIGELLIARAGERGAIALPTPEQEVALDASGAPQLHFRAPVRAERWNEQISLLTGRAAAQLMLAGRIGLLRTMPPPDPGDVASLRRSALALGIDWPEDRSYGEVVSGLDPTDGRAAALLALVPRLLRGAGYTAFDGTAPEQPLHSAVAAVYAHCTAPLRRLADRFVSEVCVALAAGTPVPDWTRQALPALPALMAAADHRAHALERAVDDLAEALVLAPCVGRDFPATVVEAGPKGGEVQLEAPAVRAPCAGADLPLGERITVRLTAADPRRRRVGFERVPD